MISDFTRWHALPSKAGSSRTPCGDSVVHVNRLIGSAYPDSVKCVLCPELEGTGPEEYRLSSVELWFHDRQANGRCLSGLELYGPLKRSDLFKGCLSFWDGVEIRKKGLASFRKIASGNLVFLWKSVAWDRCSNLIVPFLAEGNAETVLGWRSLDAHWFSGDLVARLPTS